MSQNPNLSVVIPVYNEEAVLDAMFARLYPALDALKVSYEVIFINDGSRDRSAGMLSEQFDKRPDVTRVILFNGNFGQHRAILAGFEYARGARVVPLDADLQNPPEDIGKHEERFAGESKYSLYKLIRLNFDLMTGFSLVPLQAFSMIGMAISVLSAMLVVYLMIRRLILGAEAEGVFTLFGIAFFLIGITLFGI